MGLFDWVELGLADHDDAPDWFKGAFSVTIGDQIMGVFGGFNRHTFGQEVSLVCDPEDMLLSKVEELLPISSGLMALGAGIGGRATLTYGSTFNAQYVGPGLVVRRGHSDTKSSENALIHKASEEDPDEEPDEIDVATSVAAAALSLLINAVSAALELALHFAYPKFGAGGDAALPAGYGKTPEILKICSYTITNRLIALLKMLEEKGSFAGFAKQFVQYGKFLAKAVGGLAAFCLVPAAIVLAVAVIVPTVIVATIVYTGLALAGKVE